MNVMVRFGFHPSACKVRAASSVAIAPVPLSRAPWPRSHESRCPPTITRSSGCSVPLISATVIDAGTGLSLNVSCRLNFIVTGPTCDKRYSRS